IAQAETDWRSSPRRIQLPQRPLRQSSPSPFSHRWEPLNRPRQPFGTRRALLPIGMTLSAVGCGPFPYQTPSRCPVDRTFGRYPRDPQLFGLGREPIKTEIGWIAACRFLRSEGTGRRQRALFQRQKQFRDRLMLRHLREEAQPLAIDREVACFLAAG